MSAVRLFKKQKLTLKTILLKDKNWLRFHECYKHKIRPAIIDSVLKLLSCGTTARGEYHYSCENSQCSHKKVVPFTCKNRLCSSCGKKATLIWVEKQSQLFPDVPYQHIVFTMPIEFAPLFWANRPMLNVLCKLAAECLKTVANEKRVHYLGADPQLRCNKSDNPLNILHKNRFWCLVIKAFSRPFIHQLDPVI